VPWADRAPEGLRISIVLLFACAVTPVLLWMHPVGDYFVETDFYGGYAPAVHALWAHGLDVSRYGVVGPVYELVLGLLGLTRIDLFRLAQFLSLFGSALTIFLLSGWMEKRFGRGAGWITALLMATNPTVVRYAYTASTDAPFTALLTASFVLLFPHAARRSALFLSGILAGLATLTRYTGIAFVPLGLLATLWPGRAIPWSGQRAKACAAFVLGVLLVFGPWWAFTRSQGPPRALRFYHNLAYEVYARARGVTWDNYQLSLEKEFPTFRSVIEKDPGAVAHQVAVNAYEHVAQAARELWLWPLAALAALGLLLWLARLLPGAGPLVAYGGLIYFSLVPVFYASRYHLPLVGVAAGLGALALAQRTALPGLFARARLKALGPILCGVIVLLVAAYATRATALDARFLATQVPGDLPDLGAALKRDWKGPGRPRLIARKPHLSYYADADPVPFVALDSLEALAKYAHDTRADYLYVSWPEALLRPPFAFLLVPEFAPSGLALVSAGPEGHSALYRIEPGFGAVMPAWYPREWEWRAAEGMTRIAPNNPDFWLAAGEGRHARKDYAGAREAYGYALRFHPNWTRAFMDLGNLEADTGDFMAARHAYESALAAGERSPILARNLGVAYLRTGDLALADEMLARYVAFSGDPQFIQLLAQLRAQRAAGAPAR
jgi:4-amino-4-deoxy-L-arabinose transferase-like glycosyltransferase